MARPVKRSKPKATRSGLEDSVIASLSQASIHFEYETLTIKYQKKPSTYTPDLVLGNGIIVEVKGYFDADDRSKHLLIREQHPSLDIRFVFQNSKKKIHKSSDTTYGDWCTKHEFIYADKEVPIAWTKEQTNTYEQVCVYRKPKFRKTARKDLPTGRDT